MTRLMSVIEQGAGRISGCLESIERGVDGLEGCYGVECYYVGVGIEV